MWIQKWLVHSELVGFPARHAHNLAWHWGGPAYGQIHMGRKTTCGAATTTLWNHQRWLNRSTVVGFSLVETVKCLCHRLCPWPGCTRHQPTIMISSRKKAWILGLHQQIQNITKQRRQSSIQQHALHGATATLQAGFHLGKWCCHLGWDVGHLVSRFLGSTDTTDDFQCSTTMSYMVATLQRD